MPLLFELVENIPLLDLATRMPLATADGRECPAPAAPETTSPGLCFLRFPIRCSILFRKSVLSARAHSSYHASQANKMNPAAATRSQTTSPGTFPSSCCRAMDREDGWSALLRVQGYATSHRVHQSTFLSLARGKAALLSARYLPPWRGDPSGSSCAKPTPRVAAPRSPPARAI